MSEEEWDAEANKIYNKTYDKAYNRYMSSFDPHLGFEFPKARWRHEQEANKIASVKAEDAVKEYLSLLTRPPAEEVA